MSGPHLTEPIGRVLRTAGMGSGDGRLTARQAWPLACARHADRNWKPKLRPHTPADLARYFGRRTEEMRAARHVGKGLIDGNPLDEGREITQHLDDGVAQPFVFLEMAADKMSCGQSSRARRPDIPPQTPKALAS
jgi:hypothetical protein